MLYLAIMMILQALLVLLFRLINTNPWMLFLWIPLGMIIGLVLVFIIVYFGIIKYVYNAKKHNKFYRFIVVKTAKFVSLFLNVKLERIGEENLVDAKNVLYVSNHKSLLDPVFVSYGIKKAIGFAAKKEVKQDFKVLSYLFKQARVIYIDRESDRNSALEIIKGIKQLKDGYGMMIFPEGGIKTRDVEQMVDLKPGAYKLATKANSIIQPIALIGNSKFDLRGSWFKRVKIQVKILPAIYPEDYEDLNTIEIGKKVVEMVNANYPNEKKVWLGEE